MDNEIFMKDFYRYAPEMREMIEQHFKDGHIDMSDGEFIVWGVGVMDCVMVLMREASKHSQTLDRVFLFMEYMAQQDEEIKGLLISTYDCFLNEEQVIPEALSRMGPETRKFWNQYVEHLRQFRLWKLSQLQ